MSLICRHDKTDLNSHFLFIKENETLLWIKTVFVDIDAPKRRMMLYISGTFWWLNNLQKGIRLNIDNYDVFTDGTNKLKKVLINLESTDKLGEE